MTTRYLPAVRKILVAEAEAPISFETIVGVPEKFVKLFVEKF